MRSLPPRLATAALLALAPGCSPNPPRPASGSAMQNAAPTMGSAEPRSPVGGNQGNNTGSGPGGAGAASGP